MDSRTYDRSLALLKFCGFSERRIAGAIVEQLAEAYQREHPHATPAETTRAVTRQYPPLAKVYVEGRSLRGGR